MGQEISTMCPELLVKIKEEDPEAYEQLMNYTEEDYQKDIDKMNEEARKKEEEYNNMTDEEKRIFDAERDEKIRKEEEERFQKIKDNYDGKIHIYNYSNCDVKISTYKGDYFGNEPLTRVGGVEDVIVPAQTKGFVQLNDVPNWNQDYVMNNILNPKVLKIEFANGREIKSIKLSRMNVSAYHIVGGVQISPDYGVEIM